MERAVEIFTAVCFFAIGLSHLTQPLAWVEFTDAAQALHRTPDDIKTVLSFN